MKDKDGKEVSKEELQKKVDEGLMPELGGQMFELHGKQLRVTEMPILYTKKLNKLMQPFYGLVTGVGGEVNVQDLINMDKIEGFYDNLLDIGFVIANRLDNSITREWLEENVSEKDLINLLRVQLEVNGLLNFLKEIWQGVIATLASFKTNT